MKVVTRAAPSITGFLHLGTLTNALINYCYAKQNNGRFFLRCDGQHLTPQREFFQQRLIDDLELFGLHPDFIVKQSDRKQLYIDKLMSIMNNNKGLYFCQCTAMDIANRINKGNKYWRLDREEKYPASCEIKEITGPEIIEVTANHEVKDFPAWSMMEKEGFWKAFLPGFYGSDRYPIITLKLKPQYVSSLTIKYNHLPFKHFCILADGLKVAEIHKRNQPFYFNPKGDVKMEGTVDTVSFIPKYCHEIQIHVLKCFPEIRKEYCYDQFCRERHLQLNLKHPRTTIRKPGENLDVALFFNRQADLIFSSVVDDQEFGTTHIFRGEDLLPFAEMEKEAGLLIGYKANNYFHSLLLNSDCYKLSKQAQSKPAIEYLDSYSAIDILNNVAKKIGLIKESCKDLDTLVMKAEFNHVN